MDGCIKVQLYPNLQAYKLPCITQKGYLTLKAPITTAADNNFFYYFFLFFRENKSWQVLGRRFTWNVKTCFLWKIKKKNSECCLLQILLGALRVNVYANSGPWSDHICCLIWVFGASYKKQSSKILLVRERRPSKKPGAEWTLFSHTT